MRPSRLVALAGSALLLSALVTIALVVCLFMHPDQAVHLVSGITVGLGAMGGIASVGAGAIGYRDGQSKGLTGSQAHVALAAALRAAGRGPATAPEAGPEAP